METSKLLSNKKRHKGIRQKDPFTDRRSGEDRREAYDLDYFQNDGFERRIGGERRQNEERRDNCIRVSQWTSICPDDL
jgi:hypothetical protein